MQQGYKIMNHLSTLAGVTIIGYLLYILIGSTPIQVMDRTCSPPFDWTRKGLVSAANIFAPSQVEPINKKMNKAFDYCRAWMWGAFYEAEYQKMKSAENLSKKSNNAKTGSDEE